jgi:hypothetical protein
MDQLTWLNAPDFSSLRDGVLNLVTSEGGDFWRDTFYGFRHDNGHAKLGATEASFSCEVTFTADYQAQYDQAGLMLRADAAHWIKAGVEFVNGTAWLACVVTTEKSDWSQMPLPGFTGTLSLRLTRIGDAVWVQYRLEEGWQMFRLAFFPPDLAVQAGPMACSPSRSGLNVTFRDFYLGPPRADKPY